MPISLETPATPSVKLRNIGDHVDVVVAHTKVVPWREFGTGNIKLGKDGQERTQDCVTFVVLGGNGVVGSNGVDTPVTPGMEVTYYFAGHGRWEWIEAKKARGGLNVGDVARIKYDRDEPSESGNPKKVRTVKLREARPEEAQYVAQAEQVYRRLTSTVLETVPASAPTAGFEDDEEPF